MIAPVTDVSHDQLMARSSQILAECSQACLRLQGVLSTLLPPDTMLCPAAMSEMQTLDRMSQQLEDLSGVFAACAAAGDGPSAAVTQRIQAATKLVATRDRLFATATASPPAGELDLF